MLYWTAVVQKIEVFLVSVEWIHAFSEDVIWVKIHEREPERCRVVGCSGKPLQIISLQVASTSTSITLSSNCCTQLGWVLTLYYWVSWKQKHATWIFMFPRSNIFSKQYFFWFDVCQGVQNIAMYNEYIYSLYIAILLYLCTCAEYI